MPAAPSASPGPVVQPAGDHAAAARPDGARPGAAHPGIRAAQLGLLVNAVLAVVKLAAGVFGHTYALVADAVESAADIVASLVVWGGIAVAARPADDDHPYGHGKAESLAAALVAGMLLVAAVGIAVEAVREIRTPHQVPAPWTLGVLVAVLVVKWGLARRVHAAGTEAASQAMQADAGHHLSDAITSAAAFVGIAVAVIGTRVRAHPAWASADDWAALAASGVIAVNGVRLLRPALHDLMDRMPGTDVVRAVEGAARGEPGVLDVEKVHVRRHGAALYVDIHVQADAATPLDAAHVIGGRVKGAIRRAVPAVEGVLVHMEPYEPSAGPAPAGAPRHARQSGAGAGGGTISPRGGATAHTPGGEGT